MVRGTIAREGGVWLASVEYARSYYERLRGLLGRPCLEQGCALLIERCRAVHTIGMRFALDLVFLNRDWQVVRLVESVPPGRLLVWGGWRSTRVLECASGSAGAARLRIGEKLIWEERG